MESVTVTIRRLSAAEFSQLAPQLVDIYLDAMDYPRTIRSERIRVWRRDVTTPGFEAFAAIEGTRILGVAYGFLGQRERWWDRQLIRALRENNRLDDTAREMLRSYFEIAEVHVSPAAQSRGIGTRLLRSLLDAAPAHWALLSTPEAPGEANGAFRLYRAFGFADLARNFYYSGDPRPFAILGRRLPCG
ncbi:N-acetyltransferase family protein [Corynebacterium sp. HMSC074A01]|uniref:GNAT family N-acetyltransferase n=1 Tax=Corynebacterium sp. HMSC074A01 TaxID=1715030 RepID=UPI000A6EE41C